MWPVILGYAETSRLLVAWCELRRGFRHSLMLTADEIEAVMLGAQWVAGRSDKVLSNAARDVMAKIAAVVPERLRPFIAEPSVGVKPALAEPEETIDPSRLRSAIRDGRGSGSATAPRLARRPSGSCGR